MTALAATPLRQRRGRGGVVARGALMVGFFLTLAGCCTPRPQRVVLLPEDDARPSAVEVTPSGGPAILLDRPLQVAEGRVGQAMRPRQADAAEIDRLYGRLLASHPAPPQRWRLSFGDGIAATGMDTLVAEIVAAASMRAQPDVVLIGHTDSSGAPAANDALSLARAQALRERLVAAGLPAQRIQTIGRGSRQPLPQEEAPQPRFHRRVDITLR